MIFYIVDENTDEVISNTLSLNQAIAANESFSEDENRRCVIKDKYGNIITTSNPLLHFRTVKGLNRSTLAKNSGVSIRTIEAYEQGLKNINKAQLQTIYSLAKELDCTMEDLVNEEEYIKERIDKN